MSVSEVVMPQMGADMKEGTIIRWLKAEGDEIQRGEPIAEIETDKANIEIEAFDSGIFRKAIHGEGDVIPVGTVMAVIAGRDDDISKYTSGGGASAPVAEAAPTTSQGQAPAADAAAAPASPPAQQAAAPQAQPSAPAAAAPAPGGMQRVSPIARRIAGEMGVDLANVTGSGPDGRIVRKDVEAAAAAPPAAPAQASGQPAAAAPAQPSIVLRSAPPPGENKIEDVPVTRIRQTIARRMVQSKQEAPHYYLQATADLTAGMQFLDEANAALQARISINDLVILAASRALVQHPNFNAWWVTDHVQTHSQVNVGIAIPVEGGLAVPALIDVANKGIAQISTEARDLAQRARSNQLRAEEVNQPTFSISNLGGPQFDVDYVIPIINPPQVAVLGVGAARQTPVVIDGEIDIRTQMILILSADHRATDGADGARFLRSIRRNLENPSFMLL